MNLSFYVDWDDYENGQQGIFPIKSENLDKIKAEDPDWAKQGGFFKALIGSKIISIEECPVGAEPQDRLLKFTVEI